ncbi:DUF2228 domain-containing protein [Vitiosangium sp. GDMCC 1.1324]|uniref:DUF2228 domain-containing protein n=1 Tax=Vitiosangium sp. (strain GDMCC 1.1324) TaxID=2138576 RepID=UPI000D36F5BA|nr:DUF2228 domain-containing protein [Vitiosangium sp. GDMCC 1.1324]PTL75756.1 hypothetical protein DAT35_52835 [Vitiosangium sp. GDMCC 1.1324]
MDIFEDLINSLLGPAGPTSVTISEEGHPTLPLASGGAVILKPESLILTDVDDDIMEQLSALFTFGPKLRRVYDYTTRFSMEVERGEERILFRLEHPAAHPLWTDEGLWALVCVSSSRGYGAEQENLVIPRAILEADDWEARLAAFDARRAQWGQRSDDLYPEEVCVELPPPPKAAEDEGWEAFAEGIGLSPETLAERVAPIVEAACDTLPAVRARYEQIYGLKLPSRIASLAALVAALGELPENPPDHYWEPPPGLPRGNAWLEATLSMRMAGITEWFAPGGLERKLIDASRMYDEVPPGREGPLDPRLDMRYRADAPQFVSFLSGNSDGLHWGFWYDSPDHFPVIAHNYARDSAEMWLDAEGKIFLLLRYKIADAISDAQQELMDVEDEEVRKYPLQRWRALRVVSAHLDAIESWMSQRTWDDEPTCPWPRTQGYPVGSPRLALRPDAGTVPAHVPDFGAASQQTPSVEERKAWIEEARRELAEGRAAYAHALGLYLHWLDAGDLREEAGALLMHAYEALGFRAFAGILKVHLMHRDLQSVGVFEKE